MSLVLQLPIHTVLQHLRKITLIIGLIAKPMTLVGLGKVLH